MAGMSLEISGIESQNSTGLIERYRDPLREIFSTIIGEYSSLNPGFALRCAIKGISDTMAPEGVVLSLLVFGVLPTFPAFRTLLPEQKESMAALSTARD